MTRFTIFFILISSICFGQKSYQGKIKPLLDSTNYIDNSIRIEIINYLDSLKITPANYFIDSAVIIKGDKITSETKIGHFGADGEDIPYNRPYAIIEFE